MYKRRKSSNFFDIWPAYVDILATVLMVLIFVLMTFVIAQIYLSDSIANKDSLIETLNKKLLNIDDNLKDEKGRHDAALKLLNQLQAEIENEKEKSNVIKDEKSKLALEFEKILSITKTLELDLKDEIKKHKIDIENMNDLKSTIAILEKKLEKITVENDLLSEENDKNKKNNRVQTYRSEFFDKLKSAIGNTEGIKIMGDRFIFQSELLFDVGSADLEEAGQKQLKQLSQTLKNIARKIPEDVHWILRVDGHTDKRPIKSTFPSNWELSSARAIAVVKFLISDGIPAKRIVAAGFGEHQPLIEADDEATMARNRRIEFKLDHR